MGIPPRAGSVCRVKYVSPVAKLPPSGLNARVWTGYQAEISNTSWLVARSQSRAVPFSDPATMRFPSGLNAIEVTSKAFTLGPSNGANNMFPADTCGFALQIHLYRPL